MFQLSATVDSLSRASLVMNVISSVLWNPFNL